MSALTENLRERLIEFFRQHMREFDPQMPLGKQMDSLQLYAVLTLLESEFHVEISSIEATGPDFDHLENLAQLIQGKLEPSG